MLQWYDNQLMLVALPNEPKNVLQNHVENKNMGYRNAL